MSIRIKPKNRRSNRNNYHNKLFNFSHCCHLALLHTKTKMPSNCWLQIIDRITSNLQSLNKKEDNFTCNTKVQEGKNSIFMMIFFTSLLKKETTP